MFLLRSKSDLESKDRMLRVAPDLSSQGWACADGGVGESNSVHIAGIPARNLLEPRVREAG